MKKLKLTPVLLVFLITPAFSQADNVIGYWLTEEGDSQIQITKNASGKYYGKIVWMENDIDANDDQNPNPKLKNRKIMGLQILSNFNYEAEDKEWIDGTIYDPNNGNTYDCYVWFENNNNELKIKGFVMGMRFLGRETTWKRENNLRVLLTNN
jgi:uncharacterized protein (DUF2147 family)